MHGSPASTPAKISAPGEVGDRIPVCLHCTCLCVYLCVLCVPGCLHLHACVCICVLCVSVGGWTGRFSFRFFLFLVLYVSENNMCVRMQASMSAFMHAFDVCMPSCMHASNAQTDLRCGVAGSTQAVQQAVQTHKPT
jgi:hypothetical protein